MLRVASIRKFDKLSLQGNTTNNRLKHITEGLLEYFTPLNELSEKKRAKRRGMHKDCDMPFKGFTARLTEIDKFLPLLPGSDDSKNMPTEELNETPLHAVPNGREKKSYIQGWEFEMKNYRQTCAMLEQMKIAEQVYEGQTYSKNTRGRCKP